MCDIIVEHMPPQPLIQCGQLGVSYFSKLLGTKIIFKDTSVY